LYLPTRLIRFRIDIDSQLESCRSWCVC